jgi:DNA-binding transcriptional regulator GbsR (MarR family)
MGLKELDSWRLTKLQHLPGDRREYFSAPDDVWLIFRTLADERKKREIDPTLSMLRDSLLVKPTNAQDAHAQKRMTQMHELIELVTTWFTDIQRLDEQTLRQLMKMGAAAQKLLELKDKLTFKTSNKPETNAETNAITESHLPPI